MPRHLPPPPESLIDHEIDDSFPASDPPSWSGLHIGAPCPSDSDSDGEQDGEKDEAV